MKGRMPATQRGRRDNTGMVTSKGANWLGVSRKVEESRGWRRSVMNEKRYKKR